MKNHSHLRVYVAGPYSQGDVAINVRTAIEAGEKIKNAGHFPFIPHLTHFWHLLFPGSYLQWITLDLEWIEVCEALVRLPGVSAGAENEVRRAWKLGIPVYFGVDKFLESNDST